MNSTISPSPADSQINLRDRLSDAVGNYLVCESLFGFNTVAIREGTLQEAGSGYIILYDHDLQAPVTCDYFSLRYVALYPDRESAQSHFVTPRHYEPIVTPLNTRYLVLPTSTPSSRSGI
jgi:hypothetical protein